MNDKNQESENSNKRYDTKLLKKMSWLAVTLGIANLLFIFMYVVIQLSSLIGLGGFALIGFFIYLYYDAKQMKQQIKTHNKKQDILRDIQDDFELKKEAYAEYLSEVDSELDIEEDEKSLDYELNKELNEGESK